MTDTTLPPEVEAALRAMIPVDRGAWAYELARAAYKLGRFALVDASKVDGCECEPFALHGDCDHMEQPPPDAAIRAAKEADRG